MEKTAKIRKTRIFEGDDLILEPKTKLLDVLGIEFFDDFNPEVLQFEVVKQLKKSILAAAGVEDPILVFRVRNKHYVVDGKHRLAALREIGKEVNEHEAKMESARAELLALESEFKVHLQKEVEDAFEAYRRDQESKGKPVGSKKEQELYKESLYIKAFKSSQTITQGDRKKYQALLVETGQNKSGKRKESIKESDGGLKGAICKAILSWNIPFKIQSFESFDGMEKFYRENLIEIDKSRAHDLNKINHLIDRFEIFKNRADNDKWSYEKIAAYYKTDISTVNRVMQLRNVEFSIRKFITDNEGADLQKSGEHKHRLKLGNVYRHLSKASSKDIVNVDPKIIPNYPTSGSIKERNTAAVLEFMRYEALHGKPHPASYLGNGKSKSAGKLNSEEKRESARVSLDVGELIKWGKSNERYKKLPWATVQQLLDDFLKSR